MANCLRAFLLAGIVAVMAACLSACEYIPTSASELIDSDTIAVRAEATASDTFATNAKGTLEVTADWTVASNNVDIFIARGSGSCTAEALKNRSCDVVGSGESPTAKPESLTIANLAAGTYTLHVVNSGAAADTVSCHIVLTH